ncbi:hypothetical protein FHS21_003228 [Phyllobacterium trifolii]|uniref:Uncharacterized protein n=1 Tax=Phyllobacterium trifolii TaxID=300193 RepID=A0A839UD58_9HYPH|nr:hypothetical protein [Phyllobacterium trifolii]
MRRVTTAFCVRAYRRGAPLLASAENGDAEGTNIKAEKPALPGKMLAAGNLVHMSILFEIVPIVRNDKVAFVHTCTREPQQVRVAL